MLANHKGEIPFLQLLLPFLLGIACGLNFSSVKFFIWILAPLLLSGFSFLLFNRTYAYLSIYKFSWIGGVLINSILFLTGWLNVIIYNQLNNDHHFSKHAASQLVVNINNEPSIKNGFVRFTASVEHTEDSSKVVPASGMLLIAIKDSLAGMLNYGDRLLLPASYTTIDPPFNPAEFNYKQYLAHQNIYHQIFLYPGQYKLIKRNTGNTIIAYALKTRQHLVEKLKKTMQDTAAIAVASTLILGYKAELSDELLQAYSKTGTVHILSVSGGHVAIIYLMLNIIFSFLGRYKRGRFFKAILIISLIWAYALLTGFSPAVCRAAVMISLVITGTTYSRYINTLNLLAASAFSMLLYNPFWIVDVGFQLSYLAVAGMVLFQPIIYSWINVKNKWLSKLWAACSVSIAAQAITFPLSAIYFHQFPVYFLVSNLFIIIPAEIILCTGMCYLLVPQIPFVSAGMAWILEQSIKLMNRVLMLIEHAPFAGISKIWLNKSEYIILSFALLCFFYFFFSKRFKVLYLSLGAVLLLSFSIGLKSVKAYQTDNIAFLNLRKHKGIVFKRGDKAIIITDLALTDKNYQYSIQPYLDSCKATDTLVYAFNKNIRSAFMVKHKNLVQFKDIRLFIIDGELPFVTPASKLKVDYLYLTGNPHVSVNKLNESFIYNTLIIDGSNSNKRVADLELQAVKTGVNYRILKRNNSIIIPSK